MWRRCRGELAALFDRQIDGIKELIERYLRKMEGNLISEEFNLVSFLFIRRVDMFPILILFEEPHHPVWRPRELPICPEPD